VKDRNCPFEYVFRVEHAAALWVPRETNFQNQGAFSRNNSQNNKQQQQQKTSV